MEPTQYTVNLFVNQLIYRKVFLKFAQIFMNLIFNKYFKTLLLFF